jgi:hypothetical protein
LLVAFFIAFAQTAPAANIHDYIESARHTPVIYVGVVRETRSLNQSLCYVHSRAEVDVKAVGRGDEAITHAGFVYPSDRPQQPVCDGGPSYSLQPGTWVLVFAKDFDESDRPSFLMYKATREEIVAAVQKLADWTATMTAEQLDSDEISEAVRVEQSATYRTLLERLHASDQAERK